jgi:hypothetical protein
MKSRQIDHSPKRFILVFETGDELAKGLLEFAYSFTGLRVSRSSLASTSTRAEDWNNGGLLLLS